MARAARWSNDWLSKSVAKLSETYQIPLESKRLMCMQHASQVVLSISSMSLRVAFFGIRV